MLQRQNPWLACLHTLQQHHNLFTAIVAREDKGVQQLIAAIKNDLCKHGETGRKLFNIFVEERLKTGKVNYWSTMRKVKLKTWKSSCKVIKM